MLPVVIIRTTKNAPKSNIPTIIEAAVGEKVGAGCRCHRLIQKNKNIRLKTEPMITGRIVVVITAFISDAEPMGARVN